VRGNAFTLIELILVMTILTIAVSLTAPSLANFFRGRTLDSEARRLLSLSRHGQSRAVSEGVPMDLWIDASQGTFGLEAEPSYEQADPNAVNLSFDKDIQVQVISGNPSAGLGSDAAAFSGSMNAPSAAALKRHANLPTIRFFPDGSISETSPRVLKLSGRDGVPLSLGLSRNRLNYEIQTRNP
jgi:prepilin-type N-terminal cleavage/methylation domain-containing protein